MEETQNTPFTKEGYLKDLRTSFRQFEDATTELQDLFLKVTSVQAKLDMLRTASGNSFYIKGVVPMLEIGTDYQGRTYKATDVIRKLNQEFIRSSLESYPGLKGVSVPTPIIDIIMGTFVENFFIRNVNADSVHILTEALFGGDDPFIIDATLALLRHMIITQNKEKFVRATGREWNFGRVERTTFKYDSDSTIFWYDDFKDLLLLYNTYNHALSHMEGKTPTVATESLFVHTAYSNTQKFNFTEHGLKIFNSDKIKYWDKEITWKKET